MQFLSVIFQTLKIVLMLTVSQTDWIMNLCNEDVYTIVNKKKTTKKIRTAHTDEWKPHKSNETEIEILNNMYP